jgi:hypothetical protein
VAPASEAGKNGDRRAGTEMAIAAMQGLFRTHYESRRREIQSIDSADNERYT